MRLTPDDLSRIVSRPGYSLGGPGRGALPVVQERQDAVTRPADNRPRQTEVDGEGRSFFRVSITLLVSDHRDRDGDGAISTILDTYLFALGRLLGLDRGALRKLAKSEERRRRGGHRNHPVTKCTVISS